jgi:hypothetical protein
MEPPKERNEIMSDEKSGGNTFNINAVPSCVDEPVKALLKPSANELGGFFGDLLSLVTGRVHFSAEKQRIQQEHDLQVFKDELNQKLEDKPAECLVEPRLQVVGPAMENAKFCLEEPQISEMFQNLLVNAADERYQSRVHPSFPAMIAQMSPLDAENLELFRQAEQYPIVEFRYILYDDTFRTTQSNVFAANHKMMTHSDSILQSASLSSLARQGLVDISYTTYIPEDELYSVFDDFEIFNAMKKQIEPEPKGGYHHPEDDKKVVRASAEKGRVKLTPLGKTFLQVCFDC